jgi:hypothetical protein
LAYFLDDAYEKASAYANVLKGLPPTQAVMSGSDYLGLSLDEELTEEEELVR